MQDIFTKFRAATLTALLSCTVCVVVPAPAQAASSGREDPNTGALGVSGGMDVVSAYWFRGIAQENEGLIAQPYLTLSFRLNDNITVYAGTWNSLQNHTKDTWYESDTTLGVSFALQGRFALDLAYINLYGPSGGDIFAEEFDITLSYDDSGLWGEGSDFRLSPYVTLAMEVDGGSDGLGKVGNRGRYLELGIAPSFALGGSGGITLYVPVTVGLNLGDYYENAAGVNSTFGFADIGVVAAIPLASSRYGSWSLTAGVHAIRPGNAAREISVTDFKVVDDRNVYFWGGVGIGFSY